MTESMSIIITAAVALAAVVSPVLTSIIDNHYRMKIKKIDEERLSYEETTKYKRSIFENYLKYTGRCIAYADNEQIRDYYEFYSLAYLYASPDLRKSMSFLNDLMNDCKWDEAALTFNSIIPEVQLLIQSL